jgi:hypothetical protein
LEKKTVTIIYGAVGQVFRNQKKDQVATKVPFEGDLKSPETNVWYAVTRVLQNAFVQAIQPSIDNEISFQSVGKVNDDKKNLLEKIFSKDKDNSKKKEKKREGKKDDRKKESKTHK